MAFDNEIFQILSENNIRLAYYSSPQKLFIPENKGYEVKLVDKKTIYSKTVERHPCHKNIVSYANGYPKQELIDLAIESGVYSRFNMDENIGREKFEALYTQWIIKSVAREIADEVFVVNEHDAIAGLITAGKKNGRADIGIIAVDPAFRGKGIGKSLMYCAESFYKDECNIIQVVTQAHNLPACRLYESCGYTIEKSEYFYHFWKND